jgi:hypothetical protein
MAATYTMHEAAPYTTHRRSAALIGQSYRESETRYLLVKAAFWPPPSPRPGKSLKAG